MAANLYFVSNATEKTNMNNFAAIIVETYTMGTLAGDAFMQLQTVFQNARADMGATPIAFFTQSALRTLVERGFIVAHYNYSGHFDGYVASDRAEQCMGLELANGQRYGIEPRDAYEARLVVNVPEWCDAPSSAMGVSISTR
jgi:hypothetical protein